MIRKMLTGLLAGGAGLAAARWIRRKQRSIDLAGRVALITGGSRGLGLAMARRFADEGAHVVLMARTAEDLVQAAADLKSRGAEVATVTGDVGDPDDAASAVQMALDRFGRLDVLVNNAGVIQTGPMEHMQRHDYEEAMDVHFWGAYNMTEAALGALSEDGRIVNITSIGGEISVPHLLPYSASKFALVGYSDGLRAELRRRGIRVTTVCPGLMRTGSHVNALFKGDHHREYAWFSISDALPVISINADRAARLIVSACRHGDARLTYTLPARFAIPASRLAPRLVSAAMSLTAHLLPGPTDAEGDERHTGWESFSEWSPSLLTRLADRAVPAFNEERGHSAPPS